jgi:hypothetical protein
MADVPRLPPWFTVAPNTLLGSALAPVKRKAFFSFHFDDVMRVNNVRNAWKIDHPDAPLARSFYDSSLWEDRQSEGDDSLKRLIREGVQGTSAVCVLVGSGTWARQWVRYEIARAVIDKRGLLAAHLNGITHHDRRQPDALGINPLSYIGIYKTKVNALSTPQYSLCEWAPQNGQFVWNQYKDYTDAVDLPSYLVDPPSGQVAQLSSGAACYDFMGQEGHKNIGAWIDLAAKQVGR